MPRHRLISLMTRNQVEEFLSQVWSPDPVTGCQNFDGGDRGRGYRAFDLDGVTYAAHRVAWFFHHGTDPGPLTVEHSCRNRACVARDHLLLLSMRDNILADSSQCMGAVNARKRYC